MVPPLPGLPSTLHLLDLLPMGVVALRLLDPDDVTSFTLVYANPGQETIMGVPMKDLIGRAVVAAFPNALDTGVLEQFRQALRTAKTTGPIPVDYEDELVARDRFILWAVPVSVDLVLVITENPVARIQETSELQRMESRFRNLIESAPDALVMVDEKGIIQLANTQAEHLFGHTKAELLGMPVEVLVPVDLAAGHRSHRIDFEKTPHKRIIGQGMELRARRKDGTEVPVEIALSPIETETGLLISASIRDITERMLAQEALRQSEERLRTILDNACDAFVSMDEKGCIIGWNSAAEAMFGWTRTEALGRPLSRIIIPPSHRSAHENGLQHYLQTGAWPVLDRRIRLNAERRDGTEFPVEISIRAELNGKSRVFNAFISDITERERAERELAEFNRTLEARVEERTNALMKSEARYHNALNSMMEGVQIIGFDWRYLYVNDAVVAQSTFTREELLGRTMMERYPGIEKTPLFAVLERCMIERVPERMENEFRFPNGTVSYFELSIQPMTDGVFILSTDISARKKAEFALRASEERFHKAMDSMMEGVAIIGFNWRYVYVNDALVARSPFSREELIGHTMMEKYPGMEKTELFRTLEHCMTKRVAQVIEHTFQYPNAPLRHYEFSMQPMPDGLFCLSTDITERKRAELEISAQNARLDQQNKELEQFTYIASHDLQEPLRMISSYVQLLQRRYKDKLDEDANEFIGFAVDGAQRMKDLISDLLIYARLDRPVEMTEVDMKLVLEDALHNLGTALSESTALITHGTLPVVKGSHTQMVQLLQNLVGNAIKFRMENRTPRIHVDARPEDGYWNFSVEDNGIGVDEQYADKLFIPFKRLSSDHQFAGTGIGLAIAKRTVERHGGRIWFTSKPGEGTTFHFTIPQHPPGS